MLQATYGIRYINAVRNWLKVADFFFCKITVWPASKDVSHIKDDFLTAEGYLFFIFFAGMKITHFHTVAILVHRSRSFPVTWKIDSHCFVAILLFL